MSTLECTRRMYYWVFSMSLPFYCFFFFYVVDPFIDALGQTVRSLPHKSKMGLLHMLYDNQGYSCQLYRIS